MKHIKTLALLIGLPTLFVGSFMAWRWPGVALVAGAVVMWALLHFTRMLQVLRRTTGRPVGFVDSAVMLNAKLREGHTLLHVIALTRALGAAQTPKDTQPEIFRWTDAGESHVTCTFVDGKLKSWQLVRPQPADATPSGEAQP